MRGVSGTDQRVKELESSRDKLQRMYDDMRSRYATATDQLEEVNFRNKSLMTEREEVDARVASLLDGKRTLDAELKQKTNNYYINKYHTKYLHY